MMERSMAQHTPGEWKVLKGAAEGDDMRCAIVVERGKMQYLLATIENGAPGDFCETEEANAKLMAAAPVMLAALLSRWCPKCCATSPNDKRCGVCSTLLIVDMALVRQALQPLT
jgi:hypothetical protein